jgi:hypothetical protein
MIPLLQLDYTYPKESISPPDDAEMLRVARRLTELKSDKYGLGPVKANSRVLIITPPEQDPHILNAIKSALRESGAGTIDVVTESEILNWKTSPDFGVDRPWDEPVFFPAMSGYRKHLEESNVSSELKGLDYHYRAIITDFIRRLPMVYDSIHVGAGGWNIWRTYLGEAYRSEWNNTSYSYAKIFTDFPWEIWSEVEARIKSMFRRIAEVRVTDVQGTDISFPVDEESGRLWSEEVHVTNHIFMHPRPPAFPDTNGVISGTANHFGFYPQVKAHIKHGIVEKVEGGGRFGELWQNYIEEYRNFQYPGYPSPGYYYVHECALATNPYGFRNPSEFFGNTHYANGAERLRAGVMHWGFGLQLSDLIQRSRPLIDKFDKAMNYAKEKNLPSMHSAHIHHYFTNYEVRLRDEKKRVKIVENGRITLFDDPSIREMASKYGDPDKIFRYAWVPAIPGITYHGSYERDYARDPLAWIMYETKEIMPAKIAADKKEGGN